MRFESTIWTHIQKVKSQDTTALNNFIQKYRPPVLYFITKKGVPQDEAEDLTQEVFLTIFKDNILKKADSSKGRFRTLLLAVTEKVLKRIQRDQTRQKRGGDQSIVSLDEAVDNDETELVEPLAEEIKSNEEFDQLWMLNIFNIALDKLKAESQSKETPFYEVMEMYLKNKGQSLIADKLGCSIQDVKNYLHRARSKLIEYVHEEINSYSSSQSEYEDEIRYLSRYIDKF